MVFNNKLSYVCHKNSLIYVTILNHDFLLRGHLEDAGEDEVSSQRDTTNALQNVLLSLSKYLPHIVQIKDNKRIVGLSPTTSERQIIVQIDFNCSWLEKPEPSHANDEIGYWPTSTQFPTSEKNAFPPDYINKIPFAVPCAFQDPELEKFLTAKSLNRSTKLTLNDAFDKTEFPLGKATAHPVIDCLARKAIIEGGISDTLMSCVATMIETILEDWDRAVTDIQGIKEYLKDMAQFMTLAHQTSWRCRGFIIALLVSNKLALRNYVLDSCGGAATSKDIMKHSNFFTPNLFGEIPDSLAKKVEGNSNTYKNHIIFTNIKDQKGNFSSVKRKNPYPYSSATKRVAQMNFNRQDREISNFGKTDRDFRQQVSRAPPSKFNNNNNSKRKFNKSGKN